MEREFSFRNYFLYLLRFWQILVVCTVIGCSAGVTYSLVLPDTVPPEIYESTVSVDVVAYSESESGKSIGDIGEGGATVLEKKLDGTMSTVKATLGAIKTEVYTALGSTVYKGLSERESKTEFFRSLVAAVNGHTVTVGFVYECGSDADREAAKAVVSKYTELLSEEMKSLNSALDGDGIIIVSPVTKNDDLSGEAYKDAFELSEKPSLPVSAILGLIGGLLVGAIIATVKYALDKRIKSVPYILPEEKAKVFSAGLEAVEPAAINGVLAEVNAKSIKTLLVASPEKMDRGEGFAEIFSDAAQKTGVNARTVALDEAWTGERFEAFDGLTVYWYNAAEPGVLGYLSGRVDGTVLLVDQSKTAVRTFVKTVDSVRNDYLGVILYNAGKSYLD